MKTSSEEESELPVCQLSMVRCCVCGDLTSSWRSVAENLPRSPGTIEDALIQCFGSGEFFWNAIRSDKINNVFICNCCEQILLEYNDAAQKMAEKSYELQQRLLHPSISTEPNEFIVIVEPAEEEVIAVNDEEETSVKDNQSDEDFVKVDNTEEDFEDELSSDGYEKMRDEEDETELENDDEEHLISIELVSKTCGATSFDYTDGKCRYCWRCDLKFNHEEQFKLHLEEYHSKNNKVKKSTFKCGLCRKNFDSEDALEIHITQTHPASSQWQCETCAREFESIESLAQHNLRHAKVTCTKCAKSLKSERALMRHMLIHNTDKQYQCEYCNIIYQTRSLLQKHKLTHNDSRQFVCPVCDFKFRTAWNLKRHRKLHCLTDLNRKRNLFT